MVVVFPVKHWRLLNLSMVSQESDIQVFWKINAHFPVCASLVSAATQLMSCLLSFEVSFSFTFTAWTSQRSLSFNFQILLTGLEQHQHDILLLCTPQSMAGRGSMLLQYRNLAARFYETLMIESHLKTILTSLDRLCALMIWYINDGTGWLWALMHTIDIIRVLWTRSLIWIHNFHYSVKATNCRKWCPDWRFIS